MDPIFRQSPQRDWSDGNPIFDNFINNVDGNSSSIHEFMSRAALAARINGTVFIVMDNIRSVSDTLQSAIDNREYPYLFLITPDNIDIDRCEMDQYGRITKFCYKEKKSVSKQDGKDYQWMYWDTEGWAILDDGYSPIESAAHTLGCVPVIQLNSRDTGMPQLIHQSEMVSIVQCNDAIYQLSSWLTEILANQTFSILTYPIASGQEASELTIGTNNALSYPSDSSHQPTYISPDPSPANTIQNQIKLMVEQIYRMASMSATTGTTTQLSGVAKRWDFEQQNTAISNIAIQCQKAENSIGELFEAWTGENVQYTVSYPTDYNLIDIEAELDDAIKALQIDATNAEYKAEVMKKVLTAYLPDIQPDVYDRIIEKFLVQSENSVIDEEDTGNNNDGTADTLDDNAAPENI